ncbi:hypothetical protein [Streptomyces sp. NBC_01565]|uniref:hypothetical protein n=1 Tax=Streptomyces sp. NBC_01565 TaxID=2975881 RepID=UPI002257CB21|nr:hypothetical protein [Streptomyces sp. NBC_01565]MCX4540483.1 hypothetical protein [Streptomyces sp. NBC_01565]
MDFTTAAPEAGVASAGIGSGAVILGLLMLAFLGGRWKNIDKEARKYITISAIAVILLGAANSGLAHDLFSGVQQAGDGAGSTITGTTTGR